MFRRKLWGVVLPAVLLLMVAGYVVVCERAQACVSAESIRQIPLGVARGRVVVLELHGTRSFGVAQRRVWRLEAWLRTYDKAGNRTVKSLRVGFYWIDDKHWERDIAYVTRAALKKAKRLGGFVPMRPPRARACSKLNLCGPLRMIRKPGLVTLAVRLARKPVTRFSLALPRDFDFARDMEWSREEVLKQYRAHFLRTYRFKGGTIIVAHLSVHYRDRFPKLRQRRAWVARRCRRLDTCVEPHLFGSHSHSFDRMLFLPRP